MKNSNGFSKAALDTSDLDREFVADSFKPLSPASKVRWERVKKKAQKPKVPAVTIEVEADLLERIDALAKKMRVSRNRLITRGLKAVLAATGD